MKLGFTGTREGMTHEQQSELLDILSKRDGEFHHGLCIGADQQAHDLAASLGWYIVGHPPMNGRLRAYMKCAELRPPKKYLERNHNIVQECAALIAAPEQEIEALRSGTWATVRYARLIGRPVLVIMPDGTRHVTK